MRWKRHGNDAGGLARLARDTRGNTLALLAAAMIPAAAIGGSAVDATRMYVVKVRLQQACDAGVLAGRRFMTSNASQTLDREAATQANAFFRNNFREGWMQTSQVTFTPSKTANQQVAGTATARVPMTVMKMFAAPDVGLNVTCEASFDVADADIMFVLDTTGSMACAASDSDSTCSTYVNNNSSTYTREDGTSGPYAVEKSNARIRALRTAVLNFYDTMINNADPTTNLRYGFVPYSSTVNVGRILPAGMLETGDVTYSSREFLRKEEKYGNNDWAEVTGRNSSNCAAANGRYPAGQPSDKAAYYPIGDTGYGWYYSDATWSNGRCLARRQYVVASWRHDAITYNMANYVAGRDVVDPTKLTGEMSDRWRGCIEERDTRAETSFDINNLPPDLDPDTPATTRETRWRPMWPDVIFYRPGSAEWFNSSNFTTARGAGAACGKQGRRLGPMDRSAIASYLSANGDFRPHGGTYHDVGMIWGTRMLSPDGPFAGDTAAHPGRNAPNRHIIFMTDGAMAPTIDNYSLYGLERSDQRVTGGDLGSQLARHNARFVAECRAARARNIEVWVIAFGSALSQEMRDCATQDGNHIFFAANDDALDEAFTRIARQVAMLRVSR